MKKLFKTIKFQLLNSEEVMPLGYVPLKNTTVSGKKILKYFPKGCLIERKHPFLQTQYDVTDTGDCWLLVFNEQKQFVTAKPFYTFNGVPSSYFISEHYVVLLPYDWQFRIKNMASIEIFELNTYQKKIKTYTFPKQFISVNGITLPSYLGLGILNTSSINEMGWDMVTADYYEQCDGSLTDTLVYKVSVGEEKATVYRYFEGKPYKTTTKKDLELAFFRSYNLTDKEHFIGEQPLIKFDNEIIDRESCTFLRDGTKNFYFPSGPPIKIPFGTPDLKDKVHLIDDKPLLKFADEIMRMGAFTFLYSAEYSFFPAGPIVLLRKPRLHESDEIAWLKFRDNYNNSTDDKTILKYDHSPFSTIDQNGTAVVFSVFLKDAIDLLKKENLLGDTKESAVQVFYT